MEPMKVTMEKISREREPMRPISPTGSDDSVREA